MDYHVAALIGLAISSTLIYLSYYKSTIVFLFFGVGLYMFYQITTVQTPRFVIHLKNTDIGIPYESFDLLAFGVITLLIMAIAVFMREKFTRNEEK